MSDHNGTPPFESLLQDAPQAVKFTARESVYQSGAVHIKYIGDDMGWVLASVDKGFDAYGGKRVWLPCKSCVKWLGWTLADLPTYRALLDVVEAKMRELDEKYKPGSKVE